MASTAMAPYERVATAIRADIRNGSFKPGDQLPANREIAIRYGVAIATAQKALQLLDETGWITKRPSVGTFVNEPPSDATDGGLNEQVAALRTTVADLAARVQRIEEAHAET